MKKALVVLLAIMCAAVQCSLAEEFDFKNYDNDPNLARAMECDTRMERDKAMEYYQEYLKRADLPSFQQARIYVRLAARYTTLSEPRLPRMLPDPQEAKVYLEKALQAEPQRIGHSTIRARTLLASLPIYSRQEQIRKDMEVYKWLLSLDEAKIEKLALPQVPGETGLSDLRRESILSYLEAAKKTTALNILAQARSMSDRDVWLTRVDQAFQDDNIMRIAARDLDAIGGIGGRPQNETAAIQPACWEAGPDIRVKGVWKSHKQDWFHVSQSCNLTIDAADEDKNRTNGLDGGNHVLGSKCLWYGANLSRYSGLSVTWQPLHWTDGDRIYAVVDDDPDFPGGQDTDDRAVRTPTVTLRAWEAMVHLTGHSIADGMSQTKAVTETGYPVSAQSASVVCSIAKGPIIVSTGDRDRKETPMVHGRRYGYLSLAAHGTWSLGPIPTTAQTMSAVGRYRLGADMSGELITQTQDDDLDIFRSDYVTVSDTSFSINIKEGCESAAGMRFVFASDVLSPSPHTCNIKDNSGNGTPKPNSAKYSHNDAKWFVGAFGASKQATAYVEGIVEARGTSRRASSASISATGSCTYTCSQVSAQKLYLSNEPELVKAE